MNALNFTVCEDSISLPVQIALSQQLSLEDIGALVVFHCCLTMSSAEDKETPEYVARLESPEMVTAMRSLAERKIIEVGFDEEDHSMTMRFNL